MADYDSKLELNKAMAATMSIASKFTQSETPFGIAPYTVLTIAQDPVRPEQANVYVKIDRFANFPPNFTRRINPPDNVRYSYKNLKVRRYNLQRVFKYLGFNQDPVTGHFSSPINMADYTSLTTYQFMQQVKDKVVFTEDDIDVLGYKDNFIVRAKAESLGFMGTAGFKRDGVSPVVPTDPTTPPTIPDVPFGLNQADRLGNDVQWNHTRKLQGITFNDISLATASSVSTPKFQPSSNYDPSVPLGGRIPSFTESATGTEFDPTLTNTYISLDLEGKYKAKYALIGSSGMFYVDGTKLTADTNLQISFVNATLFSPNGVNEATDQPILVSLVKGTRQGIPIQITSDATKEGSEVYANISVIDKDRKTTTPIKAGVIPIHATPANIVSFKVRTFDMNKGSEVDPSNFSYPPSAFFMVEDILDANGNILPDPTYNATNSIFSVTTPDPVDQRAIQLMGQGWIYTDQSKTTLGTVIPITVTCKTNGLSVTINLKLTANNAASQLPPSTNDAPTVNYYNPKNMIDQSDVAFTGGRIVQGAFFDDSSVIDSTQPSSIVIKPSKEYNPDSPIEDYRSEGAPTVFNAFTVNEQNSYFSLDFEGKYVAESAIADSVLYLITDMTKETGTSALEVTYTNGKDYTPNITDYPTPANGVFKDSSEFTVTSGNRYVQRVYVPAGAVGNLTATVMWLDKDGKGSPAGVVAPIPIVTDNSEIESFKVRTVDIKSTREISPSTFRTPVTAAFFIYDILNTDGLLLSEMSVGANVNYFQVYAKINGTEEQLKSFGAGWALNDNRPMVGDKIPIRVQCVNGNTVTFNLVITQGDNSSTTSTSSGTTPGVAQAYRFDNLQYTDEAVGGSGGNVIYPAIDTRYSNVYATFPAGRFTLDKQTKELEAADPVNLYWAYDMEGKYLATAVPDMSTIYLIIDNTNGFDDYILKVSSSESPKDSISGFGSSFDVNKLSVPAGKRIAVPYYVTFADRTKSNDLAAGIRSADSTGGNVIMAENATLTMGLDKTITSFNIHGFDFSTEQSAFQKNQDGSVDSVYVETLQTRGPLKVGIRVSDVQGKFGGMIAPEDIASKISFTYPETIDGNPVRPSPTGDTMWLICEGPIVKTETFQVTATCSDLPNQPATITFNVVVDNAVRDASTTAQVKTPDTSVLFPMTRQYGDLEFNDSSLIGSGTSNFVVKPVISSKYTHNTTNWNYPLTHGEVGDGVTTSTFDPSQVTIPSYWAGDPEGRVEIDSTVNGLIQYLILDGTQLPSGQNYNVNVDLRNAYFIDPKPTQRAVQCSAGGKNMFDDYSGYSQYSGIADPKLDRSQDYVSQNKNETTKVIQVRAGYRTIIPVQMNADPTGVNLQLSNFPQGQKVYATIYDIFADATKSFKTPSIEMEYYSYLTSTPDIYSFNVRAVNTDLRKEVSMDGSFTYTFPIYVEHCLDNFGNIVDWRTLQTLYPDQISYGFRTDSGSSIYQTLESVHITDYGFLVKIKPSMKCKVLTLELGIRAHSGLTDAEYNVVLNIPT